MLADRGLKGGATGSTAETGTGTGTLPAGTPAAADGIAVITLVKKPGPLSQDRDGIP